jgi:DNA-directed RNA polymerase beta' subunit
MELVSEIKTIKFGILSEDEILQQSAFEVTTSKIVGSNLYGTVHDPRSGPIGSTKCETCKQTEWDCPGHFGHIKLNMPILHPLFLNHVVNILNIFCETCFRLLLSDTHLMLLKIDKLRKGTKLAAITEKVKKYEYCTNCKSPKIEYKLIIKEPKHIIKIEKDPLSSSKLKALKNAKICTVHTEEIRELLCNLNLDDVKKLDISHPKNYCLTVFPVIPICCRPYEIVDDFISDDDLTYQLLEIVKNNNMLLSEKGKSSNRYANNLQFRIETYFSNAKGKATHSTNGRIIRGLRERLVRKEGRIRNNLLGKRVEMSARTVAGPDPFLCIDEAGIPKYIANTLTIPIVCNALNKQYLENLINTPDKVLRLERYSNNMSKDFGQSMSKFNVSALMWSNGTIIKHDDVIFMSDGSKITVHDTNPFRTRSLLKNACKVMRGLEEIPITVPIKKNISLQYGDILHRYLQDDDIVLLNRQPTLHKGSMMAFKAKIRNCSTITMNLACTKSFNADFDGDEMNIHVPQSLSAQIELSQLAMVSNYIISAQTGKPNITIVQDALLGLFKMTTCDRNTYISKNQYCDIVMHLHDIDFTCKACYMLNTSEYITPIDLLYLIFPKNFNYVSSDITIKNGYIVSGMLNKKTINTIIILVHKEYPKKISIALINNLQIVANRWLLLSSFSITIADCDTSSSHHHIISKCLVEAENISKGVVSNHLRECKILNILSGARDMGMKIANDAMIKGNNNLLTTLSSGSKGDLFNLCQITSSLGQQNIQGKRISLQINNGKRSLSHYKKELTSLVDVYESRGFISSSFAQGLNPREFIFHCISGRTGVIDTALSTAQSGYNMRRMIKVMEDIKINYDYTVTDIHGRIYQFSYGYLGYDQCKLVTTKYGKDICDIDRIADKLNSIAELLEQITL